MDALIKGKIDSLYNIIAGELDIEQTANFYNLFEISDGKIRFNGEDITDMVEKKNGGWRAAKTIIKNLKKTRLENMGFKVHERARDVGSEEIVEEINDMEEEGGDLVPSLEKILEKSKALVERETSLFSSSERASLGLNVEKLGSELKKLKKNILEIDGNIKKKGEQILELRKKKLGGGLDLEQQNIWDRDIKEAEDSIKALEKKKTEIENNHGLLSKGLQTELEAIKDALLEIVGG